MRKLLPSKPKSLYQWNEGAGEYEVVCPRCSEDVYAPTLKTIRRAFRSHYKTEPCEAHY